MEHRSDLNYIEELAAGIKTEVGFGNIINAKIKLETLSEFLTLLEREQTKEKESPPTQNG